MGTAAMRLLLVLAAAVAVWAADPVLGTWELDLAKSSYKPGPPPASQTRIYDAGPEGVKVTIITTYTDGRSAKIEHPANFDGKDYPVTGSGRTYAVSLKKIDDYRSESILKHASKVIGTAKRVVSEDGATMTVTYKGLDGEGREVDNVSVYVKQ
jgi:hypothetical protein